MTLNILEFIELNDLQKVKEAINSGIKFTKQNSPLGLAVELGCTEITKVLIAAGCKVEWGGYMNPSPLYLAAYEGHIEIVKILIKEGAKLNFKDEEGFTPLMSASAMGHLEVVKYLVETGAKTNYINEHGDFALLSAASNKHHEVFDYLLPYTSSELAKKIDKNFVFTKEKKARNSKELKQLIDVITDINIIKNHKFSNFDKEMSMMMSLLPKTMDYQSLDLNGRTALHHAISSIEVVEALLKNGFSTALNIQDDNGDTPLMQACSENRVDVVKLLLEFKSQPNAKNKQGYTALIKTVEYSKSNEIIQMLSTAGADIEAEDIYGNTAIMIAYTYSKSDQFPEAKENVKLLSSLGASEHRLSEIDFIGYARSGHDKGVLEFIHKGGNINCKGIRGISAWKAAASSNKVETLHILINNGAIIDCIDNSFVLAVYHGYDLIVQELISAGVDVNTPDLNGIHALTRAVETNNMNLVDILLKFGAKIPPKDSINGDVLKLAKSINKDIHKVLVGQK
jgi:ankyrin repeat protein